MKKEWKIPVTWEEFGVVTVEADTLEEAYNYVMEDPDDIPLPEGDYVDASFHLTDLDLDSIRNLYNDGQEDNTTLYAKQFVAVDLYKHRYFGAILLPNGDCVHGDTGEILRAEEKGMLWDVKDEFATFLPLSDEILGD